jgi:hypothetical protein
MCKIREVFFLKAIKLAYNQIFLADVVSWNEANLLIPD